MPKKYSVIIPSGIFPKPSIREISAAYLLLDYFKTDIKFIPRSNHKTPDFIIGKTSWELKTPTGTGKYNLQHTLRSATTQSANIIIDARFSKMHINRIRNELAYQFKKTKEIKRLLLIEKNKKVVEYSK